MLLEVPTYTASDHGMIMYFSHWLTWLIGVILAFIGVVLYGEYKIWVEIKKTHIEKNSKEAIEKEERISKAVETISEFKSSIEKIEESNAEMKKNYEATKDSWSKIESDYRHIKKSLEAFNDNTPKIQGNLLDLMLELKSEVKKMEEIKMDLKR